MRNIFSKILISFFMLGIFLVPVSANLNLQNALSPSVEIQTNTAEAWWGPGVSAEAIWNSLVKPVGEGIGWTVAQVIKGFLFLIFQALALLASILADILDFFIFYSIGSDVYRSTFVEAAWGTVRDVANIFFLLGLLYVAIQIVLDIGVSEKKKMIGNIIVMALLVNFSLFATQVVIDASNIVARVFYNQIESVDSKGKELPEGKYLPKSVTVSLVSTFDPNKIISDQSSVYMDVLAYLIMVGIVGYMCYLFLVMTFLFVGRIVSLWVAMIFGPIAFMSRALGITALEDLSWKNWLHNLVNSAMMAPLFIFFLYIILLLGKWIETLKKDVVIFSGQGDPFLAFISVLIPMAIIFTLLTKAKSLAVKYSGDIGKSLSSVGPALAGLALGGAALGGAALGRQGLGRLSAKLSNKEGALEYANQRKSYRENVTHWEATGKQGAKPKWEDHKAAYNAANPNNQLPKDFWTKLGGRINATQLKTKDVDHAKHEVDDIKKKEGLEGKADWQLSAIEKKKLQDRFTKEKKSDIQGDIRTATADLHAYKYDNQGNYVLDQSGNKILENRGKIGENKYKADERKSISDMVKNQNAAGDTTKDKNGNTILTKQGDAKVNDLLNARLNESMNESTKIVSKEKFEHLKEESKEKVSVFDRVGAKATSGSYDIRNIAPDMKKVSGWNKLAVGILAGIALSLRSGIKTMNVNPGKGQGDLFNDISSIVAAALKNAASGVGVKVADSHKDDHGHGGGGGGHH